MCFPEPDPSISLIDQTFQLLLLKTTIQKMNGAFLPNEIDTTLLNLAEPEVHNERGDWSAALTYDDLPLQIQTPFLTNVFGLSEYKNSNGRVNYSLSWELRESDPDVNAFKSFLMGLDEWFQDTFKVEKITGEYFSSIRPSKKPQYPDTLRTKLKIRRDAFDCDFMENNIRIQFGPENAHNKIKRGDKCRLVIQLMPVWSAGGRVGISWKVTSLQKQVNARFRPHNDTQPTKVVERPKTPEFGDCNRHITPTVIGSVVNETFVQ